MTRLTTAICIGTYNQARYLREAVLSALAQSAPADEIWIADDASTDETPEILRALHAEYPRLHIARQPENLGLPGNLSWLLAQPHTDLIVRLDSDDRLEPDYVAVLAAQMERHVEAGYAHCNVIEMDIEGRDQRVRRLARTQEYESPDEALRAGARGYRVAANCILYRAAALRQVNYYIPTLDWRACEDWHLIVRLTLAGWGNAYVPRPLVHYRFWEDAAGVRAARKIPDVRESVELYRTLLMPAYAERGWSLRPLHRAMQLRARNYAEALDAPQFSAEERAELQRQLLRLDDTWLTRMRLWQATHGLAPWIRWSDRMRYRTKDLLKFFLLRLRAMLCSSMLAAREKN